MPSMISSLGVGRVRFAVSLYNHLVLLSLLGYNATLNTMDTTFIHFRQARSGVNQKRPFFLLNSVLLHSLVDLVASRRRYSAIFSRSVPAPLPDATLPGECLCYPDAQVVIASQGLPSLSADDRGSVPNPAYHAGGQTRNGHDQHHASE
jgi:hypothetical protein